MQIGELAARSGTMIQTIRYYEREGLLPAAPRSKSGYRLYRLEHERRLAFVRRCRHLGVSIREIRDLVALADRRDQPCAAVTALARRHLNEVRARRKDLDQLERTLERLASSCDGGRVSDCRILGALAGDSG